LCTASGLTTWPIRTFSSSKSPALGGSTQRLLNGDRIVEFAYRVDQLSMKLVYPNGLTTELVAEMRASGPAFSRNGLRMLMDKDIPK